MISLLELPWDQMSLESELFFVRIGEKTNKFPVNSISPAVY